jgi:hypothetical protein
MKLYYDNAGVIWPDEIRESGTMQKSFKEWADTVGNVRKLNNKEKFILKF